LRRRLGAMLLLPVMAEPTEQRATSLRAPCAQCHHVTNHNVLARADRGSFEEGPDVYYFLECAGCGAVSMANIWNQSGDDEARYYPSPISRRLPKWAWKLRIFAPKGEEGLGELLYEIYAAVQGKQYRLAVMGIRAFFEQMMILKVGDKGSFGRNLDAFMGAGYISKIQKNAVRDILDSGHAVTHRMYEPSEDDLNIALDILDSITAAIYFHEDDAKSVAARVPPRTL
jgi:hypothetical protein